MLKNGMGIDVLTASRERISWTFDNFERVYVSFSGGKDSTVMIHIVMEEAIKRGVKVGVLFIDWECQMTMTIDHVKSVYDLYADYIDPYWVCLPVTTNNACSQFETLWTSWDENKKDLWIRDKEKMSIKDKSYFPFYYDGITFEEFVPLFGKWYSQEKTTACFVGIRTDESLNRFRTIQREKPTFKGKKYTTNVVDSVWNIYPIYDWRTKDDWTYLGKFKKPYNKVYDRMYQAGLKISQMRIDEPFGDEARRSLWIYQIIEPETWSKLVSRVSGAGSASLYSKEPGQVLGKKISLPKGHTWKSFSELLLFTMPKPTSEHYKNKIAVYIKWYQKRGYPEGIPDFADWSVEQKGLAPSWRQICKSLLRNDYWCRGLGFGVTKSSAYKKYLELMKRRRSEWAII